MFELVLGTYSDVTQVEPASQTRFPSCPLLYFLSREGQHENGKEHQEDELQQVSPLQHLRYYQDDKRLGLSRSYWYLRCLDWNLKRLLLKLILKGFFDSSKHSARLLNWRVS